MRLSNPGRAAFSVPPRILSLFAFSWVKKCFMERCWGAARSGWRIRGRPADFRFCVHVLSNGNFLAATLLAVVVLTVATVKNLSVVVAAKFSDVANAQVSETLIWRSRNCVRAFSYP